MVRIVFNDERALTYYRENMDGVYFGWWNYVEEKVDDHNYNYYYTFTPEMYERAVPLEDAEK